MTTKSHSLRTVDLLGICFSVKQKHALSRYVLTKGNFVCCSQCCYIFREKFALEDLWEVKIDCINKSNKYLHCDSCGNRIPIMKKSKLNYLTRKS